MVLLAPAAGRLTACCMLPAAAATCCLPLLLVAAAETRIAVWSADGRTRNYRGVFLDQCYYAGQAGWEEVLAVQHAHNAQHTSHTV